MTSQVRAKDRELTAAQAKLSWAEAVQVRNKEMENELLALQKQLGDATAEMRTLQQVSLSLLRLSIGFFLVHIEHGGSTCTLSHEWIFSRSLP